MAIAPRKNASRTRTNLERSFGIDTLSVGVASSVVYQALVDVPALDSIAGETILARARVGPLSVTTIRKFTAGVRVQHALVIVGASLARAFRFYRVSFLATTVVRSDRVVALPVATYVGLCDALVDV